MERARLKANGLNPNMFRYYSAPHMFKKYELDQAIKSGKRPPRSALVSRKLRSRDRMKTSDSRGVDKFTGVLLGAATGDAMGGPMKDGRGGRLQFLTGFFGTLDQALRWPVSTSRRDDSSGWLQR